MYRAATLASLVKNLSQNVFPKSSPRVEFINPFNFVNSKFLENNQKNSPKTLFHLGFNSNEPEITLP